MNSYATIAQPRNTALLICFAILVLAVCYVAGIWFGLWNTYGDAIPGRDRIHFAFLITALPPLLPLTMNIASIPMLISTQNETAGIVLLVCSGILAALVCVVVVPMGKFCTLCDDVTNLALIRLEIMR